MIAVIFQFGKIFKNAGGPRPGKSLCKRNIDITCTRVNHFISVWDGLRAGNLIIITSFEKRVLK